MILTYIIQGQQQHPGARGGAERAQAHGEAERRRCAGHADCSLSARVHDGVGRGAPSADMVLGDLLGDGVDAPVGGMWVWVYASA